MSSSSNMSDRFSKIRELRESICSSAKFDRDVANIHNEFLTVMNELKVVVDDDKSSVEDIKLKLSEIMNVLIEKNGKKNE